METAAISYRVADFLKKHPPFHVMEEIDLVQLSQQGRVKFFEPHQYVSGHEASRTHVLVIQQGTVLLWDERGTDARLLDVRGAGDILGIDQWNEGRPYPFSARSVSDVLVYAFPTEAFDALVEKYPYAKQYVSAHSGMMPDYRSSPERRGPQNLFLYELVAGKTLPVCDARASIDEAAQCLLTAGAEAMVVLDSEERIRGVLTARSFLEWIAKSGRDAKEPVATLLDDAPQTIAVDATVADGVLAMGSADAGALVVTSDGTVNGHVQAILSSRDLGSAFGDRPGDILREIRHAADIRSLRALNQRSRAFVLQYLTNAASTDWLTGFTSLVDKKVMRRILAFAAAEDVAACWCFCGSAGREETLTLLAPQVLMIADDHEDQSRWVGAYQRVLELLRECDYLPNADRPYEPMFYAANVSEWQQRYSDWVNDPILKEIHRGRALFDMRPVFGRESLWKQVDLAVRNAISREFLLVLANDCLATLPPLTFFQNAVVDESGEETAVFHLEQSALRPLIDVGRVFGMAAKRVFGSSTHERFAMARTMLAAHSAIFEEASQTLRTVLWQQGRVGISQGTAGSDLPPALLNRYDQQILRRGFRSILRLLEFTADLQWIDSL